MSRSPGLEPLESRYLPSVALAEIDSTMPADDSALLASPREFAINFDPSLINEVDELFGDALGTTPAQTLAAIVALDATPQGDDGDFAIDRVGAGGMTTPVLGFSGATPLQDTIATTTAPDGTTTGSQLTLTPAPGASPLPTGTYQIDIVPGTLLDAAFSFVDSSSAWTSTEPIPIAQFTILGQGKTLADATPLGDIGPSTWGVSGFIDPQGSQSQVALYRITLPAGHSWQLSAQALTQSIGSPLDASLAILDDAGNVLATGAPGDGSASAHGVTSITTGLPPGTYDIAVSASGNLPGWSGGYNLKAGTPGTAGFDESDGAFRLNMVATPIVGTTTLTGGRLEYEDPLETSPTGLELSFSGPISTSLFQPDQQETALEVVDASGRAWPMTATNYQVSSNTLSLIFDEPLPAGRYSLIVPAQGGLTDPSGRPIVAPAGNPPGVLASWAVASHTAPSDPDNLGVLWPGPVNVTWNSAVSGTLVLSPGQEDTYRYVVIEPGLYLVQCQTTNGPIGLEITGSDGTVDVDVTGLTGLNNSLIYLGVGVYSLQATSEGPKPIVVHWTLQPNPVDWDSLPLNGVGQEAALSMALTVTNAEGSGEIPANTGAVNAVAAASSSAGVGGSAGSNPTSLAGPPIAAGLLVSMNTGLMGLPGPNAQSVGAVGPMAEGALSAVADRVRGLLPGITYASRSDSEARVGNGGTAEAPDLADSPTDEQPQLTGPMAARTANPEAAGARNDGKALARADRIVRLVTSIEDLIGLPSGIEPEARPESDGRALVAAAGDLREPGDLPGRPGQDPSRSGGLVGRMLGDLRVPVGLIATITVTYGLGRPIETWLKRKPQTFAGGAGRPHRHRPIIRGPHWRPIHMATTAQARMPRTPC